MKLNTLKQQIWPMIALLILTAAMPEVIATRVAAATKPVPAAQKAKAKQPQPSQPAMPGVPATVPRPTPEQTGQTAPFTGEQKSPLALLGKAVRASIGGHMATIILTDYDLSDATYDGLLIRNRSMNSTDVVPHFEAVHGLRPYPYAARPNYAFQFVLPGEDESVLINIAQANAAR